MEDSALGLTPPSTPSTSGILSNKEQGRATESVKAYGNGTVFQTNWPVHGYPRTRKSSSETTSRDYHSTIPADHRTINGNAPEPDTRSSSPCSSTEQVRPVVNLMRRFSRTRKKTSESDMPSGPTTRSRSSSSSSTKAPVIPPMLQVGISVLRITHRKRSPRTLTLDPATAILSWDTKSSARVSIDDIRDIRSGDEARNYREEFKISGDFEQRWMSIIYHKDRLKALHVIFTTEEVLQSVAATINALKEYREDVMAGIVNKTDEQSYVLLQKLREEMDFEGVERLCRQLHINTGRSLLKDAFHRAGPNERAVLDKDGFRRFVALLKERREINDIWQSFQSVLGGSTDAFIDLTSFRTFLRDTQKTFLAAEEEERIFAKFAVNAQLSLGGFTSFLLSVYNPILLQQDTDLSLPLNEYFISSSHNTYLLGRQIRGDASIEGYIRVLQRGCRCVEIDCWDGPDGPVVTHGRTLTSMVSFYDVIVAISKFAFQTSPYPLILSLEVRCNKENQMKIVSTLEEVLGTKLLAEALEIASSTLPSPEQLKHKVLIKAKWTDDYYHEASTPPSENTTGTSTTSATEIEDMDPFDRPKARKQWRSKPIQSLKDLCVYSKGLKFRNFALPESKTFDHIFSFSERAFFSSIKDDEKAAQLQKHNMRYLMRVYPSALRVSSSNFDPIQLWRNGVQFAALNWQTYDLGVQLNEAMFSAPQIGYVLKPPCLRLQNAKQNDCVQKVRFSIEIISAQQLPRPKELRVDESLNPSVEIEILWENSPLRHRTATVKDNGLNPMWREEATFELITDCTDLVFVRFLLMNDEYPRSKDKDRGSIFAAYCVKLKQLCQGYRHVPLFDLHGEQYLFSTLFVKLFTEITDAA